MINNLKLKNIEDLLKKGIRMDGRKIDEFRKIEIETDVISKAEGSARVRLGDTEVLVGVKASVGKPYPDRQDAGVLMTGAELTAMSHPEFESGPPRENAIELARVVDRAIREAEIIDTKDLCIEVGEAVWVINVDIYTMNYDGNAMDAATLGAMAALATAKLPEYKDGQVDRDNMKKKLPVNGQVVSSTFFKIGDKLVVDATKDEEDASVSRLTIGIKDNNIVSLQKDGAKGMSDKEINECLERAIKHSKKLLKALK